jgi:hypothetical protein
MNNKNENIIQVLEIGLNSIIKPNREMKKAIQDARNFLDFLKTGGKIDSFEIEK